MARLLLLRLLRFCSSERSKLAFMTRSVPTSMARPTARPGRLDHHVGRQNDDPYSAGQGVSQAGAGARLETDKDGGRVGEQRRKALEARWRPEAPVRGRHRQSSAITLRAAGPGGWVVAAALGP